MSTPFYIGRQHVWFECKCNRMGCQFCDGGLGLCTVCGGFEGSLLPECPGYKLTPEQHDENYAHYCAGTGPFAGKGLNG